MRNILMAGLALAMTAGLAGGLAGGAGAADPQTAIFAGGCFWCVESDYDRAPGVLETISGYTGGTTEHPTYHQVGAGGTGHHEAVEVKFDPEKVSYRQLVDIFWRTIDPTDDGGQFCDRGESYKTAVFVANDEQRAAAEASKAEAEKALGQKIVTPIVDAGPFWPAEDYHQDYYEKEPMRYNYYRWSCGRNARIKDLWGDQAWAGLSEGH